MKPVHSSWKAINTDFEVAAYDTKRVEAVLPEWDLSAMAPVEITDVARIKLIHEFGGVYTDTDVSCVIPVHQWLQQFSNLAEESLETVHLIVGVEFPKRWEDFPSPFQLVTWTLAGAKGNPVLQYVLEGIKRSVQSVDRDSKNAVMYRTSPPRFTQLVLEFVAKFAEGEKGMVDGYPRAVLPMEQLDVGGQVVRLLVDGVVWKMAILPYRAFGFHQIHKVDVRKQGNRCVYHRFEGSWR